MKHCIVHFGLQMTKSNSRVAERRKLNVLRHLFESLWGVCPDNKGPLPLSRKKVDDVDCGLIPTSLVRIGGPCCGYDSWPKPFPGRAWDRDVLGKAVSVNHLYKTVYASGERGSHNVIVGFASVPMRLSWYG